MSDAATTTAFERTTREWPLGLAAATAIALSLPAAKPLMAGAVSSALVLAVLCGVILVGAVALVRHAEVLAHRLGEPGGTLLLTMAITGLEAAMVGLVMSTGEEKPTLARDTMFAVVMLVFNGFLGIALLLGGIRHHQQPYNPQSANAFLVMIIPFAVLTLMLPNFTRTTPGPTLSGLQMAFLSAASVAIYAFFLLAQTRWHREFFVYAPAIPGDAGASAQHHPAHHPAGHEVHGRSDSSTAYHVVLLALYGAAIVFLAKKMSEPLDAMVLRLGAPIALAGFILALLVLTPESIAAVRAARRNELQRAINILLGSVLASIGLTVPIVIVVVLVTGRSLTLGLEPAEMLLLGLTLAVSLLTFGRPKTHMLLGSVHLLLFAIAILLVFDR